jgi:hypothetical protein
LGTFESNPQSQYGARSVSAARSNISIEDMSNISQRTSNRRTNGLCHDKNSFSWTKSTPRHQDTQATDIMWTEARPIVALLWPAIVPIDKRLSMDTFESQRKRPLVHLSRTIPAIWKYDRRSSDGCDCIAARALMYRSLLAPHCQPTITRRSGPEGSYHCAPAAAWRSFMFCLIGTDPDRGSTYTPVTA